MDKREKVIKGLECCKVKACIYSKPEIECPYEAWRGEYESAAEECTTMLASDALELLKAQEPVAHGHVKYEATMMGGEDCVCSVCGHMTLAPDYQFCPYCGAKFDEVVEHEE